MNFAKFLRAPFPTEYLRWLLLNPWKVILHQSEFVLGSHFSSHVMMRFQPFDARSLKMVRHFKNPPAYAVRFLKNASDHFGTLRIKGLRQRSLLTYGTKYSFKNGPSNNCGRQPLKMWNDMVSYGMTISLQILKAVFHKFYLVHSGMLCPMFVLEYSRHTKYIILTSKISISFWVIIPLIWMCYLPILYRSFSRSICQQAQIDKHLGKYQNL